MVAWKTMFRMGLMYCSKFFYNFRMSAQGRRHTRYQAAILRGSQILLIRHQEHQGGRSYWLLPGAGH